MFVRKLDQKDWKSYKAMRLEALTHHAAVYGGSLKDEAAWDDDAWKTMLSDDKHAFFALFDDQTMAGGGAVFTHRDDATGKTALLAADYVREKWRGQRLSHLIYTARLEWIIASERFDRVLTGHREGNEASRRANQAFGFEHIGKEEKAFGDGTVGTLHHYEMRLR